MPDINPNTQETALTSVCLARMSGNPGLVSEGHLPKHCATAC